MFYNQKFGKMKKDKHQEQQQIPFLQPLSIREYILFGGKSGKSGNSYIGYKHKNGGIGGNGGKTLKSTLLRKG